MGEFDPNDLPLGTSVVTVIKFDFLDAIDQFKKTLPADYLRDSWFKILRQQCSVLHLRYRSTYDDMHPRDISLLYLQVNFLNGLYRLVCGDVAGKCGWEGMLPMLSSSLNGPEDKPQTGYTLFNSAAQAKNEGDLLSLIAYGQSYGETGPTAIITTCPVSSRAVSQKADIS
ncbi:hypothetical protein PG987_008241 [Apiospora arundinis]